MASKRELERQIHNLGHHVERLEKRIAYLTNDSFNVAETINKIATAAGLQITLVEPVPGHVEVTKKAKAKKGRK